jgi:two-component system, NtrC family, sensor histidine kinase KinB
MMDLRTRLIASHGVIIALMLLVAPLALYAVYHLVGSVDVINAQHVHAIEATERLSQNVGAEFQRMLADMAHPERIGQSQISVSPTPVERALEEAKPFFASPAERTVLGDFEKKYRRFEESLAQWRNATDDRASIAQMLSVQFGQLRESVVQMRRMQNASLSEATGVTRDFAGKMLTLLIALIAAAIGIGLIATIRSVRAVADPVEQLNALVHKMSAGDFNVSFRSGTIRDFNALGRHFESMGQAMSVFRTTNLERIVAEQRRSDAVLDSIGDGLVIFSEEGSIDRINPVAERQLGIEPNVAIGRHFEDVGDHIVGQRVRELLRNGELAGPALPEIHIDRDGDHRILAYSLHRFVEGQSGQAGVVMVMRDVTMQREFDKMRTEFVLRASHELRTPIASVRMGLGLLGEKFKFAPGSRDQELYDTVQQELQRMVNLLTDLLDLSRLRMGEHTLERAPVDVAEMVKEARDRFALIAGDSCIELIADLKPGLPRVSLCRGAMDRVLDNLITNALRHTPAGGNITLCAYRTVQHVQIAVADTGEGIASNQQAMIFQPFVQIGSKRGGAGLGLAICREIVSQHGGEIAVSSQLRRGTTFTISIPD